MSLPTGAGTPFPEFAEAYTQATAECRAVRTMSASLSLSGRAGAAKLGARIDAGLAEPARLRLEGFPRVHFGGQPFFVLVSRDSDATLVLTRDRRVLRGASPAAIVEALTGIAVDPAELRAIVSGCGFGAVQPAEGRSFGNGWAAAEPQGVMTFLRQMGGLWRVVAARRGPLTLEYGDLAPRPATVRLHTSASLGVVGAELTVRISQVEINVPFADAVFEAPVPRDAVPLTLEELRSAGPLGQGS